MAIAECGLNEPAKLNFYIDAMSRAKGISNIIEAVQGYLGSWSKELVAGVQRIDGGWAPFDELQQPRHVYSPAAVHCIRDSLHRHCMALREAGIALTPELLELDEFFYAASRMLEKYGEAALRWQSDPGRLPAVPTRADVSVNW
jgi:hypothetical protein